MHRNGIPQPPRLITFDLDGTLADTVPDLHASVNQMQHKLGNPARSEVEVRSWVGNGIDRLVNRSLTGDADGFATEEDFATALQLFKAAYTELNGRQSRLYAGVLPTLRQLQQSGKPMVCVTNKSAQFARPLIDQLGLSQYFSQLIAGDTLASKKPAPDQLLSASLQLGVEPSSCLHVGDSISDIKAARAANFSIICVDYGYNHGIAIESLEGELAPDALISEFQSLLEYCTT